MGWGEGLWSAPRRSAGGGVKGAPTGFPGLLWGGSNPPTPEPGTSFGSLPPFLPLTLPFLLAGPLSIRLSFLAALTAAVPPDAQGPVSAHSGATEGSAAAVAVPGDPALRWQWLYDLEGTLGKGHFAVVRLARHVFTGERVAVKVIEKSKLEGGAATQLLQEVRCMKLVQHPNVVRLYEVIDTQAKLYLILELGDGGDMFDHIMQHEGGLGEERAKHYFAQIVHAISYCHRLHVVHRDLKPENVVFFREQGVVKLTDFGFSNCFQPGTMLTTSCGSLAYSAPEILLGDEYEAPAVDIWSLGVILYMLVCGQPPFQEANDSETLTMILDCRYVIPSHISPQCADLIAQMLQRDPRQRASLEGIEGHPWLQGVDPSPASRSLLPLTSHRRVSQEEHEIILQAMMCGNIADRETIQEALEADRYNHVTATYFLLAERILREKQEKESLQSRACLVDSLAQRVRCSEARPPLPPGALHPQPEGLAGEEPPGKPLRSFSALAGEEPPSSGFRACDQPIRALIRPSLVETPVTKSTLALQQISEEEEQPLEPEDGEDGEVSRGGGLFRRRTSSLNQEQMSDFQSAKAALLFCRGLTHGRTMGKGPNPSFPQPHSGGSPSPVAVEVAAMVAPEDLPCQGGKGGPCPDPQTQGKEELEEEECSSGTSKEALLSYHPFLHLPGPPKMGPEAPAGVGPKAGPQRPRSDMPETCLGSAHPPLPPSVPQSEEEEEEEKKEGPTPGPKDPLLQGGQCMQKASWAGLASEVDGTKSPQQAEGGA
ncbi:serine/threonine-protein kinase MARK2-like [Sceloporus undulatus]|uniref:serine/threonine-protein kinase MARK2-like n=1 Tax=Sceloporus undulatus TaxID=8520 RepID=UPI001C4A7714|nr:serine/threonine-protein kinase MARK2-like [Sceloporus undulatus]